MLSRRDLLKLGLAGGAGLLLTPGSALAQMRGGGGGGGGGGMGPGGGGGGGGMGGMISSPPTTPFIVDLPVPGPLAGQSSTVDGMDCDFYELFAEHGSQQFHPELPATPILCYRPSSANAGAGFTPGPVIVARKGRPVHMKVHNNLNGEHTIVHLHGGHIPASEDGHTMDNIDPMMPRTFVYPNNQIASTIWFHEHAMHVTATHAYRGLAGLYYITDELEEGLKAAGKLPPDEYDVPLVIQDRTFNADGTLNYTLTQHALMHGMQGDVNLVNGAVLPRFEVKKGKYRFRILNGSNGRFYNLQLSSGAFTQIGTDGGLLPRPVDRSTIYIGPGERIEVIVDFSRAKAGSKVFLKNTLGSGRTADVMRFDVISAKGFTGGISSVLRDFVPLLASDAVRTRTFTLGMNMMAADPSQTFTINGVPYMHDVTNFDDVQVGATEIWEFVNPMGMPHPMHVHDIMWQVLDRNGSPPPAWEVGWKDTWVVPANGRVRVIGRFDDYECSKMIMGGMGMDGGQMVDLNQYMLHCHILEHEDYGMMWQFKIQGAEPMPM